MVNRPHISTYGQNTHDAWTAFALIKVGLPLGRGLPEKTISAHNNSYIL